MPDEFKEKKAAYMVRVLRINVKSCIKIKEVKIGVDKGREPYMTYIIMQAIIQPYTLF